MKILFIDETDLKELKQNPFNLSRRDRKAMDGILDEMKTQGLVRSVPLGRHSAIASPAFVVWKNGKPRVVVDLRRVNLKLYPDAYPLPRQDDILGALGGSTVFTSLNIVKGFFQQPLAAKDQMKTAFVTPYRGYEYLTVSTMGLRTTPGFF